MGATGRAVPAVGAWRSGVPGLGGTIDGILNSVVRLASGHALALCECGLETTAASESEAWMWLLDHACLGGCDN